jgi:hypothetical protein
MPWLLVEQRAATVLRSAMTYAFDQKISARNPPQNATLASSTNHSEAFGENGLPSLATLNIIVGTRHELHRTVASAGNKS